MWAVRNIFRIQTCRQLSTAVQGNGPKIPLPAVTSLLEHNNVSLRTPSPINLGVHHTNKAPAIESPLKSWKIIETPKTNVQQEINDIMNRITDLRLPTGVPDKVGNSGIQAARLIIIRRKKMKKHKRKKLWKRMRYEWAKVQQRRALKREKEFQAELVSQIKAAEQFSAEQYVTEKLNKVNEVPLPRYYKGKRLPAFIIKDLIEQDKIKRAKREARLERIEKYKNWRV